MIDRVLELDQAIERFVQSGQTLLIDGGITTGSTRALPAKKP